LSLVEKELQQVRKDNAALARYINARRNKEEAQRKEEARKKAEEEAQRKAMVVVPRFDEATPIVFHKAEVWPGPLPSRNDIQSMINYVLEKQAKGTDELLHRLIEERDGKKLQNLNINHPSSSCAVNFPQTIYIHVVHQRATLQCQTPLPSR
jgi:hypothetical protein